MTHLLKPELDKVSEAVKVMGELSGRRSLQRRAALAVERIKVCLAVEHGAMLQALRNVGIDTACGACMCQAFTGSNSHVHTCTEPSIRPHA